MKLDGVCEVRGSELGDNDSSDVKNVRGLVSSSPSPSESERIESDSSDNDSGFVGISRQSLDRPDGSCTPEAPESNVTYDRESILRDLASNPQNVRRFRTVLKIGETRDDSRYESGVEDNNEGISTDDRRKSFLEELREAFRSIPDSMLHLLSGTEYPGDSGRPSDRKPEWLDEEKLRRGQKFAQDYMFPVYYAEMLSLFALFSFEDNLKPLIITGKSSTPYTAFKRYLSTGLRVRNWYTQDLWAKGTDARKDISTVRAMHAAARRRLEASTNEEIDVAAKITDAWCPAREILLEDFADACRPPAIGQCPYATTGYSSGRPKGINQSEMALTQWGFIGLVICYPKSFGIHYASDEELEAYCHLWRSIGYQLGIEDEFNFCRGTLDEIRQRSNDFVETWVKPNLRTITPEWEHMMRCIFSGMEVILPGADFETSILYLGEILDLEMPRLYASLSYKVWIAYNLRKYIFNYAIKFPGMTGLLNNLVNRALDRGKNLTPAMLEAIELKLRECPASGQPDEGKTVRRESPTGQK